MFVYVLRLRGGKYYVGKTLKSVNERFAEHVAGSGAAWTRLHEPIDVLEEHMTDDPDDENKYTIKMMGKYGVDNVRGGAFVTPVLSPEQISVINSMVNGNKDKCFKCGESGHYVATCPGVTRVRYTQGICYRCGRPGHYSDKCYARYTRYYSDSDSEDDLF